MKYTQNSSYHLFYLCIVYLSFYSACNFMICDFLSKVGMDHLTFLHEKILTMLICYCQIQFALQNNSLTLKFSTSQEQRKMEVLLVVKISDDKGLKLFVAIWFSNFAQKDLTIGLPVVFDSLTVRSFLIFPFFLTHNLPL